jgi:transglutaminase-like putative cysteine protease
MSLDRALSLHTAALAILGAVFVGQGRDAALIPVVTVLAAVAAIALTDVLEWLRLNRWLANLLAIVAVAWSLREFFHLASDEKLVSIANMLCYLQIILLFQGKSSRVYWQLVVLSTLQVVVGAALDVGPQFGLLLAVYGVVALSSLVFLCIYREVRPVSTLQPDVIGEGSAWKILLARPQVAHGGFGLEEIRRQLPAKIVIRQTVLLAVVTLQLALVFFYVTPRLGDSSWQASPGGGAATGFRPEARLPEGGRIHMTNQVVMRVALSRMADRRPVMLVSDPYFHGEILTDYRVDESGSRWARWNSLGSSGGTGRRSRSSYSSLPPQTTTNMVRQDVILEAGNSGRRFAIMPAQPIFDMTSVPYGTGHVEAESHAAVRQQRYSVATPAIRNDRQMLAIPIPLLDEALLESEKERALAFDRDRFPELARIAADVIKEQELYGASAFDRMVALERHFHAPDAYRYSLNLSFKRNAELDPVEDFVANHKTGHCQYFASALALMLRSQGIPARVVVGYKGGAFNSVGHYYVVQGRHSHAWVEAWLPPEEVPDWEVAGVPGAGGAWYRLDPTPSRDRRMMASDTSLGNRLAQAFDYVELLWRDYVLSLNNNRQEEIVYDPLIAHVGILPSFVESRRVQRWLRRMSSRLGLDFSFTREPGAPRVFEGGLAILVIVGLGLLLLIGQGLRLGVWFLMRRWQPNRPATAHEPPPFYGRLERLLARLPLLRACGETPQELAADAKRELSRRERAREAAELPAEVVAAYYRVRFGGHRLDKSEIDAIERALVILEGAVRRKK